MSIAGDWKNQRGSTMTLQVNGSKLSGTYRTAVGDEHARSRDWDLSGVVGGDLLSFTVIYPDKNGDAGSITAWAGRYFPEELDEGGKVLKPERISSMWCLTHKWTSEEQSDGSLVKKETKDWNHITAHADVFERP